MFDVETPNRSNDRISAIGAVTLCDGKIIRTYYTLVDPQTHFDEFNSYLTGIYPSDVQGKPSFGELWEEIRNMFDSCVLAAHNATFDLGVLSKCLRAYGIPHGRYFDYICTCRVGRYLYPSLDDHKLNTMAEHFGIELDHHNAMSDCLCCAELLRRYSEHSSLDGFIRVYDTYRY